MGILIMILVQNLLLGTYVSIRLYMAFFTKYSMWVVITILLLINNLFLITRVLNKYLNVHVPEFITFLAHIILGITIYLVMLYLATDLIRLIFKALGKPFITNTLQGVIITSLTMIIFIYGYINSHYTHITEYNIALDKPLNKPLKIVALADLHIGADMSQRRLFKEVEIINNQKPDIIMISGDVIDHDVKDIQAGHLEAFNQLKAPLGVYAVYGNHEYYSGTFDEVMDIFNKAGFKTLVDNATYIDEYGFYILGRDSLRHTNSDGSERKSISELAPLIEDKSKPIIILDHVPKGLVDGKSINADIQFSGHTHDGQFFPMNLIVRAINVLSHGIIIDNGFYYIVTSGLGLWGPPMRVGTQSEIMVLNVTGK